MKYNLKPSPSCGMSTRNYAAELNAQQHAAVTSTAQHSLIIAGAGSGKTRTLTYRVAWLVEQGIAPWRILLLTFTNKAAKEMLQRVKELAGLDTSSIWGGTFHSICNRILRRHADKLGFTPNFTILDSDDQNALMKSIHKQLAPPEAKKEKRSAKLFPTAKVLLSFFSLANSLGIHWKKLLLDRYPDWENYIDAISAIASTFTKSKKDANSMDFDDLISQTVKLLEEHQEICQHYQEQFEHILVDEYQDTNTPQEKLISLLSSGTYNKLMVVGDDAQSIYSWRGAKVEHILNFKLRYPEAQIYKIETNYRSVSTILALSNAAIALNSRQYEKKLQSNRQGGVLPALVPVPDKRTEARFVAQRIEELTDNGEQLGRDIAVLYRAHYHSMELQMELVRRRIPFKITSGLRFFEQAHVKDLLAHLRLLVNPRDEIALKRILMMIPRVGEKSAQKIAAAWLICWHEHKDQTQAENLRGQFESTMINLKGITPSIKGYWQKLLLQLDALENIDSKHPEHLVQELTHHLKPYILANYENAEERIDDLDHLLDAIDSNKTLDEFLAEITLMSELDQQRDADEDEHCVCLSTIHQAKGLEWKSVFILSLADGMFPTRRAKESLDPSDMEEETRLFYVAVTRAEDQLYLMYPRYSGGYDGQFLQPSVFLSVLKKELVDLWEI